MTVDWRSRLLGKSMLRGVGMWALSIGVVAAGAVAVGSCWGPGSTPPLRSLVPRSQPSPILIVGTFHFAGSSDVNYVQPSGVFSESRQRELAELATRIAAFRPTKVLLEWPPELESTTNEELRAYVSNRFDLPGNEVYQIGFRVAKSSGIEVVHLVDHKMGIPSSRWLAENLGQTNVLDALTLENRTWNQDRPSRDRDSWLDVFVAMNSPESIKRDHSLYIDALPLLGAEGEYDGTDATARWYARNLRIYTNITRLNQPGDRLFLLIGAGHVGALKSLLASSSRFELVDPLPYLRDDAAQQGDAAGRPLRGRRLSP